MVNKKNLPLYVALAVPVLMILLVAAFIYLPGAGKKPAHDFLYASGNGAYSYDYYGQQEYQVGADGRLVRLPVQTPPDPYYRKPVSSETRFYIYDVVKKEAREVGFEEAQAYKLDSSATSSDGYAVERGNGGGGFPFGGPSDYNSWFLKGHNRSQKLNLKLVGPDSYNNFRFLGWVE